MFLPIAIHRQSEREIKSALQHTVWSQFVPKLHSNFIISIANSPTNRGFILNINQFISDSEQVIRTNEHSGNYF